MVLSDGAGLRNQLAVLNNLATCSAKLPPSKPAVPPLPLSQANGDGRVKSSKALTTPQPPLLHANTRVKKRAPEAN